MKNEGIMEKFKPKFYKLITFIYLAEARRGTYVLIRLKYFKIITFDVEISN